MEKNEPLVQKVYLKKQIHSFVTVKPFYYEKQEEKQEETYEDAVP